MKRIIAATSNTELENLHDEVIENVIDYIESGEAWSYDDVVSETYDQINTCADASYIELTDSEEDYVYEMVMTTLEDYNYIDKKGFLLYEAEE